MSSGTSEGEASRPDWPTLLHCAGEEELRVVRDQDEWELDPELHHGPFQTGDRLIDSTGREYQLVFHEAPGRGRNAIHATGERLSPADVRALAERHITSVGARPEWLAGHLDGIADSLQIRATILYLGKLAAAADAAASSGGDEE